MSGNFAGLRLEPLFQAHLVLEEASPGHCKHIVVKYQKMYKMCYISDMLKFSIQDTLDLVSDLENQEDIIIWMRNKDYRHQLYISENYTRLFGQDYRKLYEYPEFWFESLVDPCFNISTVSSTRLEKNTVIMQYYSKNDQNEIMQVNDRSFHIYDQQGNEKIAVMGIAICKPLTKALDPVLKEHHRQQHAELSDRLQNLVKGKLNLETKSKPNISQLSSREQDCVYYLLKGYTAKECAKSLHLSPRTVEHYLENIKNKLKVYSRSELIAKLLQENLD